MQKEFELIHDLLMKVINKFNEKEKIPFELPDGTLVYKAEMHTIVAIGNEPGINVTELAAKLSITKGAISQMTKKLLKKKFVYKLKDKNNDKEINLYLTESGKILFAVHNDLMAKFSVEIESKLGGIDKDNINFLINFFNVIHNHLLEHI